MWKATLTWVSRTSCVTTFARTDFCAGSLRSGRASGREAILPHASAIAACARLASKSPTTTRVTLLATYQRWKKSSSALARERLDRLGVADDRPPIGMARKGSAEERLRGDARRAVLALLHLFEHYFQFALQLHGIEGGVLQRVGQDIEPGVEVARRQHEVVDGLVERGPGVDLAARGLDLARDLPDAATRGALEQHVLEDVRDAGQLGRLIGGADRHPRLERDDFGRVVFLQHHTQAIG